MTGMYLHRVENTSEGATTPLSGRWGSRRNDEPEEFSAVVRYKVHRKVGDGDQNRTQEGVCPTSSKRLSIVEALLPGSSLFSSELDERGLNQLKEHLAQVFSVRIIKSEGSLRKDFAIDTDSKGGFKAYVQTQRKPRNILERIRERAMSVGGVDLDIPPRGPMRELPSFD